MKVFDIGDMIISYAMGMLTVVVIVLVMGCQGTSRMIDSSLMSGNQNPAGTAIGVGIGFGVDALEYLYEYYEEEDYEEDYEDEVQSGS